MSNTISEVQASKRELEAKIAQMLLKFEEENGVRISNCWCNSYDKTADVCGMLEPYAVKHNVDFSISVTI